MAEERAPETVPLRDKVGYCEYCWNQEPKRVYLYESWPSIVEGNPPFETWLCKECLARRAEQDRRDTEQTRSYEAAYRMEYGLPDPNDPYADINADYERDITEGLRRQFGGRH
jgi:hypothetical protein